MDRPYSRPADSWDNNSIEIAQWARHGAAIEGLDKAITLLGIGALIGQETAQVHYDIQHGVPVGVAVSGALVNGTLIVGAGALAEPFGGPIGSAAATTTVGAILPSNEQMGYAVGDAPQNFYDKLMPPIGGINAGIFRRMVIAYFSRGRALAYATS